MSRRAKRVAVLVDVLARLGELPLDDAIAVVATLTAMKSGGALPIVFADDPEPPPIQLRTEDP